MKSMKVESDKEKNLMNLSIIRCNKLTIKKIKCLANNMNSKYYIKLFSNNKTPLSSKIFSFKNSNEIEINESFPLDTFQQQIIKEIKIEFIDKKNDTILFNGVIVNQNFIFDESAGDYILDLYHDNGNKAMILYYSVEFSAIDSFETFDKSVKYNENTNQTYLDEARKNISLNENIKNDFIENLQYLEIIITYIINVVTWENIIETLFILISITFIILYFKIFYIYVLPLFIVFFHIKNKNKIKDLIKNKKNPMYKRKNDAFFLKLKMTFNNIIDFYEMFIQKIIAGKKSIIIEFYKSLILTVLSNVILFYFNIFYIIKWKWVIIISIWAFVLSYNSFCLKIYNSLKSSLSSFSSMIPGSKILNRIKNILKSIINLLIPFYPVYKSFKEDNSEVYSSIVKSQGLKNSNEEIKLSRSISLNKGAQSGNNLIKFELYENERWWVVVGWSKNMAGNIPTWCRVEKPLKYCDKTEIFLPNNENNRYQWSADWKIEKSDNTDSMGWEYADDFNSKFSKDDRFKFVRRRKWVRYANKI